MLAAYLHVKAAVDKDLSHQKHKKIRAAYGLRGLGMLPGQAALEGYLETVLILKIALDRSELRTGSLTSEYDHFSKLEARKISGTA